MAEAFIPESIEIDLPCAACGYNLRGLSRTGKCPECGQPIDPSMRGDLLQFANAGWLKTVLRGANLMYYSIGIGIIVGMIAGILTSTAIVGVWFTNLLTVLGGVLNLLAVWMITTQEPRVSFTEQQVTWRRVLRFCAVVNLICMALEQGGWRLNVASALAFPVTVKVVQGIAGIVSVYGFFAYAEGFARRVPDLRLARSTRIVKWGLLVTQSLTLIFAVVMLFRFFAAIAPVAAPGGPPAAAPAAPGAAPATPPAPVARTGTSMASVAAFGCFVFVAFLVFGLWALRLLYRYRKELREALQQAKAGASDEWGPDDAPTLGLAGP